MPSAKQTVSEPAGYSGLYNFHKYWGKKPAELMKDLILALSPPGGTVLDPFVGFGAIARESILHKRNFTGIDINPVATRLCRLIANPPSLSEIENVFQKITDEVKRQINKTYVINGGDKIASHYLWEEDGIKEIWTKGSERRRIVLYPTAKDYRQHEKYAAYKSKHIRNVNLYKNSRINTIDGMSLADLLSGRARHNIDLIYKAINKTDGRSKEALLLCLTSAVGQMSRMVFSISGRGKKTGAASRKIEVGSWIIGYWRPKIHFEINVWNCFENRLKKLLNTLRELPKKNDNPVESRPGKAKIICGDCRKVLRNIKNCSVDLIVTDPPHADRIPYLELSELWNAVLNEEVNFENEIIISNAGKREMTPAKYGMGIHQAFEESLRVLKTAGYFVLLFNARDQKSWDLMNDAITKTRKGFAVRYLGCFDCKYSAGSVVQDNRAGGLKTDYGLVFQKTGKRSSPKKSFLKSSNIFHPGQKNGQGSTGA